MDSALRLAMRTVAAPCGAAFALIAILVMGGTAHAGKPGAAFLVLATFAALSASCLWFARTGRRSWWPALFGIGVAEVIRAGSQIGVVWIPHSDVGRGAFVAAAGWAFIAVWHAFERMRDSKPDRESVPG